MENSDNFRALAENANDGILIATGKGDHVYANRRASEITGYSLEELLETRMQDLAHPVELKKVEKRLKKRLEGKSVPTPYETAILRKDGKVPVEITGAKTTWEDQPADIVIVRDITDRKHKEEELEALSTTILIFWLRMASLNIRNHIHYVLTKVNYYFGWPKVTNYLFFLAPSSLYSYHPLPVLRPN